MEPWLTHLLTLLGGGAAGGVLPFVLKWRKQSVDNWQALFAQQNTRIALLEQRDVAREKQIAGLTAEHTHCLETQAELRAEVALLRQHVNQNPKAPA